MPRLAFAAVAFALVAPAAAAHLPGLLDVEGPTAPLAVPGGPVGIQAGGYELGFQCPDVAEAPTSALACPLYVLDAHDVFGQPVLVVDPRDPARVAFSALHGGRGAPGLDPPPSERSRANSVHQPHTVFRSTDGGAGWEDAPYYRPDALAERGEVFGEDNALVLDGDGRMVLASLYAYRDAVPGFPPTMGEFHWATAVWKLQGVDRPLDYHRNVKVLPSGNDGANAVDGLALAYVPATDAVVLVTRETVPERALDDGPRTFARFQWSLADDGALWVDAEPRIGPCRGVSNPVVVDVRLVLACLPDEGDVRILAVDTRTWTSEEISRAPVDDGRLLLVPRGDAGDVALLASRVDDDGRPSVRVAWAEGAVRWSSAEEFAPDLSAAVEGARLLEARVTAAAYVPSSGHLHVVYMERYDLGPAATQEADRPEFYKAFGVLQAEGRFLGRTDLAVGRVQRASFSPVLTGAGVGAFDDLHDSIVVVEDARGRVREFVAFGDYGYVRFGEVVERGFLPPVVPAAAQVPPVPVASAVANPVAVGLPAGLAASAMVARMLMARRKVAAEVGAE